jgi:COP9 signalosome complex subunit 6
LVILNISDHHTRVKSQNNNTSVQVYGALIGVQNGRGIEIFNSFEIPVANKLLDHTYFLMKQDQYKQVFPKFEFLGWYSTLSSLEPTPAEIELHPQFYPYNDTPLFLSLNPNTKTSTIAVDLPIHIYEQAVDAKSQLLFTKSSYKIETGEAERISIEHVAHSTNSNETDNPNASLTSHLVGQKNAIKMLNTRIKLLYKYILDVKNGTVERDDQVLRAISSLCNRLPAVKSEEFDEQFLKDYNDVLLISYLASITKGSDALNELLEKFTFITQYKAEMKSKKKKIANMGMGKMGMEMDFSFDY